jgi:hypothetical protein
MRKYLLLLIILQFKLLVFGQENLKTGIIYGDNFAYSLTAPNGWVLDNESGVDQGLYAVFYKKGGSWKNSEVIMYTNTSSLLEASHKTIDQLIKYDLDDFRKNYKDILISDGKDIVISDKLKAKVKYLSGKSYGNFEAVAYIYAGKTGVLITMSSRTKKGFDSSLLAFESLVKSYFFMADKVTIKNTKKN